MSIGHLICLSGGVREDKNNLMPSVDWNGYRRFYNQPQLVWDRGVFDWLFGWAGTSEEGMKCILLYL